MYCTPILQSSLHVPYPDTDKRYQAVSRDPRPELTIMIIYSSHTRWRLYNCSTEYPKLRMARVEQRELWSSQPRSVTVTLHKIPSRDTGEPCYHCGSTANVYNPPESKSVGTRSFLQSLLSAIFHNSGVRWADYRACAGRHLTCPRVALCAELHAELS